MRRRMTTAGVHALVYAGFGLFALPAGATQYLMGPVDSLAVDQPRITFGLVDESGPSPTLIGPEIFNSALLDTGANGVLLAAPSYNQGEDYGQPIFNGSPAQYAELGVAGTSLLDVHDPWSLRILDSDGVERIVSTDVRAFGDSGLNIGSFAAIVGMPAMDGLVVEIDMRPTANLAFQRVAMHDTLGQAAFESAATLNVDLRMLPPEHTDLTLPESLRPTFSGLPLIDNVDLIHTGGGNSGGAKRVAEDYTFLVDTGAQTMIISEQMATDLGIDYVNGVGFGGDVVDALEVGGIGGTTFMPLVTVDRFLMPLQGGNEAVFTDLLVGVLDIDGAPFDAVMGMNMLTTGYLSAAFGGGGGGGTLINPLYGNEAAFQVAQDNFDIDTVDDLFEPIDLGGGLGLLDPVFDMTREDYDLLVESQILPETDDPAEAYANVLALEEELGAGSIAEGPLFDKVVFDFTASDGTALMRLDLASQLVISGDLDGDGDVDTLDLGTAYDNFTGPGNSLVKTYEQGDTDGDGDIDNEDLLYLLGEYSGSTEELEAFFATVDYPVPEPGTLVLMACGGGVIFYRRHKSQRG